MGALIARHGDVVEVTLDWDEVRNALGPLEGRELRVALERAADAPGIGAVVLSANGRAFCAGGDLPRIIELAAAGKQALRATLYAEFQGLFRAIAHCPVPVITAVDGPAVGLGCDLALAGNLTFMGAQGWLAQGWIKAGLVPATGGAYYVARRGGPQALWQFITADRTSGPQAERLGLAVSVESARVAALELAMRLAALPRESLKATVALSRIPLLSEHLEAALNCQIDFLTDPSFADRARRLLSR